jgi:hypothetical protein
LEEDGSGVTEVLSRNLFERAKEHHENFSQDDEYHFLGKYIASIFRVEKIS